MLGVACSRRLSEIMHIAQRGQEVSASLGAKSGEYAYVIGI